MSKIKVKCQVCFHKFKFKSNKKARKNGWFCDECDLDGDEMYYCKQCIRDYFRLCGQIIECIECEEKIPKNTLKKYIKKKDWRKHQDHKSLIKIRSMKDIVSCPGIDCPMYYWQGKCKKGKGKCIECKIKWCIKCNSKWKKGHKKKCVGKSTISKSVLQSTGRVVLCPFCKTQSMKISGCKTVECKSCGKGYCFKCNKKHNKCWC